MQLIVDSGGSKTDWAIGSLNDWNIFSSGKLDCLQFDSTSIPLEILAEAKNIEHIYFYGAALYDQEKCQNVIQRLTQIFRQGNIICESDLVGACRATAGSRKGIVCILGTGSNSCTYDGNNIVKNIPALGYIIGDEGSGVNIGKTVLKAYLYGELKSETRAIFESKHFVTKSTMLTAISNPITAKTYIAQFASFPNESADDSLISLVKQEIDEFFSRRVLSYDEYLKYPVHFVGSIAYFYSSLIKELCSEHKIMLGSIIQKPINRLIEYHK